MQADGSLSEPRRVNYVRFDRAQSVSDERHRSADAGAGTIYVDAVMSDGAFEIAAGSRIEIDDANLQVAACKRCCGFDGAVHHWELTVR